MSETSSPHSSVREVRSPDSKFSDEKSAELPVFTTRYEPCLNDVGEVSIDFQKGFPSYEGFKNNPAHYLLVGRLTEDLVHEYTTIEDATEHYRAWAPVPRSDRAGIERAVANIQGSEAHPETPATIAYLHLLANRPDGSLLAREHIKEIFNEESDLTFSRDGKGSTIAAGKVISSQGQLGPHLIVLDDGSFFLSGQEYTGERQASDDVENSWKEAERQELTDRLMKLTQGDRETIHDFCSHPRVQLWLSILAAQKGGSERAAKYMREIGESREITFSIDEDDNTSTTPTSVRESENKRVKLQ